MKKILAFFQLIRITNLAILALSLCLFYFLILVPVHKDKLQTLLVPFTYFDFALFVLSVILIAAGGNIINDYFDFELDKEFKSGRPLASGIISLDAALYMHMAFAGIGVALGFYLGWQVDNYKIGYFYVVSALLLYAYSAYLKKIPLAGNLVVSALTAFVFVLVLIFDAVYLNSIHAQTLYENTPFAFGLLTLQVKFYGGFAFLTNLAREIVKDLEDKEGDAAFNINTLPVVYGDMLAKAVGVLVLLLLLSGVGYFLCGFVRSNVLKDFAYLLVTVGLPTLVATVLLILAKTPKQYARISLLLKVIMLMGILSIPAFYYFHQAV